MATLPCGNSMGKRALPRCHVGETYKQVSAGQISGSYHRRETISECAENYLSPELKTVPGEWAGQPEKEAHKEISTSSSNSPHNNADILFFNKVLIKSFPKQKLYCYAVRVRVIKSYKVYKAGENVFRFMRVLDILCGMVS